MAGMRGGTVGVGLKENEWNRTAARFYHVQSAPDGDCDVCRHQNVSVVTLPMWKGRYNVCKLCVDMMYRVAHIGVPTEDEVRKALANTP